MEIAFIIGRIIMGIFFLYNSFNHFSQLNSMSGYAQSKGVPVPKWAVLGSGMLLLIGGLSIITGYQLTFGLIALLVFFLPVTFIMHAFWKVSDQMAKMGEMINFSKDLALMGSVLIFLAIPQPWPFSLGS